MMMLTGAMMHKQGVTIEQINNASEKLHYDNLNLSLTEMGNNKNNTFTVRAVGMFVDFIGFTMVEGMRTSFRWGYKNPQYNFDLAWKLMFVGLIAVLIKPIIVLLMFLGFGTYYLVQWIRKLKRKHTS